MTNGTVDIDAVREAWDRFEAGCAGLLARKCAYHRPYMGCPLDCGDVENDIGEEWKAFQPLVAPLLDELKTLRRFLDVEKVQCDGMGARNREAMTILGGVYPDGIVERTRAVTAERDRLRSLLEEAIGELDDTGGDFAKQRAAEIRGEISDAPEIPMPPATHVLWGGHALCDDLRLRGVPRLWPEDQRWISLKGIADGAPEPPDRCEACWTKATGLVDGIRQIGSDR